MASKQSLAVLAIIAAALPFAMATDFIVGDDEGWRPNPTTNYSTWAEGKMFMVGDTLVFNYEPGKHNVIPVGGADFKACNASQANKVYTSGSDRLTLQTAGRKWYLCGKKGHCEQGQKLVITVMEAMSPAPAPSSSSPPPPPPPSSLGSQIVPSKYQMLMAAAAAAAAAGFFMA